MDYLCHLICPDELQEAENTKERLRDMKDATGKKELKPFLGLRNLFRRLVPNFQKIAERLHVKLEKVQPTKFGALNEKEKSSIT